ncbi:MAG: penicillin-binding transpeptidase domain-containing protein [Acidimicrobiales bacterium]
MERRIRRLGIFMVLCFLALFIQLNNIQVLKANSLANNPANPGVLAVERSQPRGSILSSDGVILASSVAANSGAYKYRRVYNPDTATLFSQIVGFDSPIYGQTGVESTYNSYLESHTRPAHSLRDLLVNRTTTDNVTLTINSQLQLKVAARVDEIDADGTAPHAAAVVINVKTGAIEAMYGLPTYDPSGLVSLNTTTEHTAYQDLVLGPQAAGQVSPTLSQAYQDGVEPGSTFKVVTSSAVYDHDPSLANHIYPAATCINGPNEPPKITGRPEPLCNYPGEDCGGNLQSSLPASCDTAFAQMGIALGPNLGVEAQAFGFNQQPPIDLTGAAVSSFPAPSALTPVDQALSATAAFGQGFGSGTVIASPLQMALVAAGIANQGVIMTPHVMQSIRDSQGNLVETYTPKPWLTATSPLTASAVTTLMEGVVTHGTAVGVFPASWDVAAKTGTAETGTGPLGNSLTNDWMIAFAPANDPTVAVAVSVPNQGPSETGALVSGPPTRDILGDALAAGF